MIGTASSLEELKAAIVQWATDHGMTPGVCHWWNRDEQIAHGWEHVYDLQMYAENQDLWNLLDFTWACWSVDERKEAMYESFIEMIDMHGYGHEIWYGRICFYRETNK